MGVTIAFFQIWGTSPSNKEMLKIWVNGVTDIALYFYTLHDCHYFTPLLILTAVSANHPPPEPATLNRRGRRKERNLPRDGFCSNFRSRTLTALFQLKFGDNIFMQTKGVPQGGNVSPLLADLTLSYFEYEYAKKHFQFGKDMIPFRYMDDILTDITLYFYTLHDCHYFTPLLILTAVSANHPPPEPATLNRRGRRKERSAFK
ncbi:hypothetical protein Y032_0022g482 [Ancylostoma ceylanicum]|uniref:Reverse transcriptase domain-containing protein n=1 Tax=Ancylostoma ceylanicum TaxID=53326 RepID=A0A016UZE9_9BILA|nr:hypothetical protein Y032_0022g482 [Ancylostoma ceylanicum]